MDLNYSENTTAVHVTYTLTSIRRIETFQKKRKHNTERRSHAGPVLKLSRHGIHGCVVDSQFSNPPLVISNKNRGEPGIASISMRARVRSSILLSRISAVIDEARERRDRSEDSAGSCDSQESFCQGYRSVEPRNERVISTNRFPNRRRKPGDFLKRDEGSRRICRGEAGVRGGLHPCAPCRAGRLKASNHTDVRTAAAHHGTAFLVCWKCEVEELNRISTSMPRKQPVEWDSFGSTQSRAEIRTPVQPWNAI